MSRAATIAQIRRLRSMGLRPRRVRPPRPIPPVSIQLAYANAIIRLVSPAFTMVMAALEREVKPLLGGARRDDLNTAIDQVSEAFFRRLEAREVEATARHAAERANRLTGENLARQTKSVLGLDLLLAEPRLEGVIPGFITENVALIKSVPNRFFDDVERLAANAVREGRRWEDLARDIQERTGITEDRARLIARDQVGKLVGQIADARHSAIGVTHFIWRTVRDNRVRPEHETLNGERFPIGSGHPEEGIPGEAINCRCYEEPDFSELLDASSSGG